MLEKDIIRSWEGGPLRPNKSMYELWAYVCDRCRETARSGVCLIGGEWLCHSCEHGHVRQPRPENRPVGRFTASSSAQTA
jgi:hypothetical protein